MSICIEKLAHSCEKNTTKDGLQVFQNEDGTCSGFCFPCNKYIADPYDGGTPPKTKRLKKTEAEIKEEMDEINSLGFPASTIRSIRPDTFEYFQVRLGLSEEDGVTPSVRYFPYTKNNTLSAYKAKLLERKLMWWVGDKDNVDLFGWQQAIASGSKTLFITEGEDDTCALYQALKDNSRGGKWEHLVPAVVSIPHGSGNAHKILAEKSAEIRAYFREVVLVFDQDDPGKEAVRKSMQSLPMARSVSLPSKDPNQALEDGRSKALCNSVLFRSETPKNSRLIFGSAVHAEARQQPEWGLAWPWEGMTTLTRGLRWGETIYIGAGVKMGKSELVNSLIAHLITEHKMKVFAAKPEETNRKSYQMVCGKVAGKIFHDPTKEFDFDAYDKASEKVSDNLVMLDLYQHLDWSTLRADILQAINLGCRAVFIDPITNITNGISSGEANTVLQGIAQDLAAIAKDHQIMAFIFCHLKAAESGAAHERGGKVLSHQFAGSRAMMRSCHMMIGLEGNKDPDLEPEQRNMRRLVILEDREFGASGVVKLYWDHNTGLFNEVKE